MTSVHSLQFAQNMTVSSEATAKDTLITEDKQYTRRTKIHRHLMTVMASVHISIIIQSILQLIFPLIIIKHNYSWCSTITPITWLLYLISNFSFFILFFKFWRQKADDYLSKFEETTFSYDFCIKLLLVIPISIIGLRYGTQSFCSPDLRMSSSQSNFMALHLFLELTFLKMYLNWFRKEINCLNQPESCTSSKVNSIANSKQNSSLKTANELSTHNSTIKKDIKPKDNN